MNKKKINKMKKLSKEVNSVERRSFFITKGRGLTGFIIKIIATLVMLLDHVTAATFNMWIPFLYRNNFSLEEMEFLRVSLRSIGRLSFPLFCFLLVEGFVHTKDVKKYLINMLIFGIISEVPFDMAIFNTKIYWGHQNVYFTLFLGLVALVGIKSVGNNLILKLGVAYIVAIFASLLQTDYGFYGVILIVILYIYRENKKKKYILASLVLILSYGEDILLTMLKYPRMINSIIESVPWVTYFAYITFSILAFVIMELYNGKKGKSLNKYIFYGFYPVHLALLGILREVIGK